MNFLNIMMIMKHKLIQHYFSHLNLMNKIMLITLLQYIYLDLIKHRKHLNLINSTYNTLLYLPVIFKAFFLYNLIVSLQMFLQIIHNLINIF